MLNKQRRIKPLFNKAVKEGKRAVKERFGVDPDVCTGDHACIRLSGCPSLTVKDSGDPLKEDPVAHVESSCVGCGNCGEVAHAAVLCPRSIAPTSSTTPPAATGSWPACAAVIGFLQRRRAPGATRTLRLGHGQQHQHFRRPRAASPIKIAVLAMGGQGGGVLADWIVDMAEHAGWWAQTTSVPGVAQRTGATIYYLELLPEADVERAGRAPAR